MKKLFIVLAICGLGVFLYFRACGRGSDKDKSSSKSSSISKSEGLNYQKACEELDFVKAHEILNELRDEFVKGLSSLGTGKSSGLLNEFKDEFNKNGLEGLIDKGLEGSGTQDPPCMVMDIEGYQNYVDADLYIFREEAAYLMSLGDNDAETKVLKLLLDTPLDGIKLPEGYCDEHTAVEGKYYNNSNKGEKTWLYHYCVDRFNKKCDMVLDLSILLGNQTLAGKVLSYYKEDVIIEHAGYFDEKTINTKNGKVTIKDTGYIWYDTKTKDAAQKKYDEAVKNGVFQK